MRLCLKNQVNCGNVWDRVARYAMELKELPE
jgi:hypothetical protein